MDSSNGAYYPPKHRILIHINIIPDNTEIPILLDFIFLIDNLQSNYSDAMDAAVDAMAMDAKKLALLFFYISKYNSIKGW